MTLVTPSQSTPGNEITAAAINDPVNQLAAVVNGNIDDTNVSSLSGAKIADTTVTANKIANASITDAKMDLPRWWQELGRTKLTSAADVISVTVPVRKYLTVLVTLLPTAGTIEGSLRFNNDGGNNYAFAVNTNGTTGVAGSQAQIAISSGASSNIKSYTVRVDNANGSEKAVHSSSVEQSGIGAASAPGYRVTYGKWTGTAQITSVQIINVGGGDFASDSEVVVLGHD